MIQIDKNSGKPFFQKEWKFKFSELSDDQKEKFLEYVAWHAYKSGYYAAHPELSTGGTTLEAFYNAMKHFDSWTENADDKAFNAFDSSLK